MLSEHVCNKYKFNHSHHNLRKKLKMIQGALGKKALHLQAPNNKEPVVII